MNNQDQNQALPEVGFDINAMMNKGKNYPKTKIEYLKEGTAAYRVLPPISQTNKRLEHLFYLHWVAYMDENGQERNTKVLCTKGTEGFCPICQAHDEVDEQIKHAEANGVPADRIKLLKDKEAKLRVSPSVYLTAVNSSQEIVVLQLSKTVFGLLEKKIMEAVQQRQFDPTAANGGVWFQFKKQGKGRDSVTVEFVQKSVQVDGEVLYKLDRTPLSPDVMTRMPSEAVDIHDPSKLYISIYTAKELADFLRGQPLPQKWKKNTASTGTGTTPTGAPQADTAPALPQSVAPAAEASSVSTTGYIAPAQATYETPANSESGTGNIAATLTQASPVVVDPLAEAMRLRNLAKGNKA